MTLINTDGMALIGPGSEWFWTALSGLVLAVTFFAIYRQLRLEASSRAFDVLRSYENEGAQEPVRRAQLQVLTAIRDGAELTEIPGEPARYLGSIWERYALLARKGHIDIDLLWEFDGASVQWQWLILGPMTRKRRETRGPAYLEHFEWLAARMADLDRRAGERTPDPADLGQHLDGWIASHLDGLRAARERRTIIVESVTDLTDGTLSAMVAAGAPPASQTSSSN
jgi:hypothetical protein